MSRLKGGFARVWPAAVGVLAMVLVSSAGSDAATLRFKAPLGPEATGATGSGSVRVDYDDAAQTLRIVAEWSGLSGTTTVAHIHCCTAVPGTGTVGVAVTPGTLPGFPVGTTSGAYTSPVLDLAAGSTYPASFVNNFAGGQIGDAEEALLAGLHAGKAYFNVHSTTFPGGEIRGFLAVPEPASLALLGLGLAALGLRRRRR